MRMKTYKVTISERELKALFRVVDFAEYSLEQVYNYPLSSQDIHVAIQKKIDGYPLDIQISNRFIDKCQKQIRKEKKS